MESTLEWRSTTQVEFLKKLPGRDRLSESLGFKPDKILVVYDKRLRRRPEMAKWLGDFQYTYAVQAGEGLKDLAHFATHLKKIFRLVGPFAPRSLAIVGLGGGSIGDFTGFLASVVKRGVPLVHIPSTLLAAMDSAHGGKTALNVGEIKNQVGTFYPAGSVLLVRSLFEGLPPLQLHSASGELVKMALLTGGDFYNFVREGFAASLDFIWEALPTAVAAKNAIVERDPFERLGERQLLNLGHSLGHALEAYFKLPHGIAVGQGLIFAVNWSAHGGFLRDPTEILKLLRESAKFLDATEFVKANRRMSRGRLRRFLAEDKKMTDAQNMNFVFLEKPGGAFRQKVSLDSFLTETQRQGWTQA